MRVAIPADEPIIQAFSDLYWNQRMPWTHTSWLGIPLAKCPLDLWIYQEILFETRPDLIIECGTYLGGSALYFASLFDLLGNGYIVTVDNHAYGDQPKHHRIDYLVGSSIDPTIIASMTYRAEASRTMVIMDSDHRYDHVKAEIKAYAPLVSVGCYLVVEDTNTDGSWGEKASKAAAEEYVSAHPNYSIDTDREKHLLTFNPNGWIRRTS